MPKYTPADWEDIRKKFHRSLMAETALSSLAQNLEIKDWHARGADEKPSKYFDFTWEELLLMPEIAGRTERIEHLCTLLKETLAFDDPFGDMVAQVEDTAAKDNPVLKALTRLGIPENFPLSLANLSDGTRAVCAGESVLTIGEFATLSQKMSQRVIIGGDFRSLLNALSNGDEAGIGQFLPFRPGAMGLHLPEALGLAAGILPRPDQLALGKAMGAHLATGDVAGVNALTGEARSQLEAIVRPGMAAVLDWFKDERAALLKRLAEGGSLAHYLAVINDPAREAIAARLVEVIVPVAAPKSKEKPRGFFARLFGRG